MQPNIFRLLLIRPMEQTMVPLHGDLASLKARMLTVAEFTAR